MSAGVQAAIRCDTPGCSAYHRGPHGGRDLCPAHRIEAAA